MKRRMPAATPHIRTLLQSIRESTVRYKPFTVVFAQGDECGGVMYIDRGRVKLTTTSRAGREAVVAVLGAGAFFGEGALAGQRCRKATAETVTSSTITRIATAEMRRGLQEKTRLSDVFRSYLLARNVRIEEAITR